MSNYIPSLSEANNKLLQNLEKKLDAYSPTRLKLFNYTEKHGKNFFDNPKYAATVALSGFALIGGIASIPLHGGAAFLLGGFALGASGMFGSAAHFVLNAIANPIMKNSVIKNFNADEEVNKYIKVIDRCLQANKNMDVYEKAELIRELSNQLQQKSKASLEKVGRFAPYLDEKSEKDLLELRDKLFDTTMKYADNGYQPLSKNEEKVSQQGLMSKWISKLSGSKESTAEMEPNRPGMRK
ncbi:hypothetical protein ACK32R_20955 [Aeromonas dhakensis]|jgi:hypothetical protein|uniref:hypothetical protein n=1 Tax=Aeromonas dhakensis TaxID=196024 RepID=UPI003987D08D